MIRRQKIGELFLQQRKFRVENKQRKDSGNKIKFGQSLRCFSLEKSKTQQQISLRKDDKIKKFQGFAIPTKKSVQQLSRLISFYQFQKSKRSSNTSEKILQRKKSSNYPLQISKNSSFYNNKQSKQVKYFVISKSPKPIVKKINIDSFKQKIEVHNSKKNIFSQRKRSQSIEQSQFEVIKRKAFIPTPKLRSSPKKLFFK